MFQVTSRVQPDHLFNLSDNRRSLSSDLYMGGDRGAAGEIANQDSVAVHTESQQASSGSMLSSLKAAIYLCGFCSSPVHPEGSKEARFKEIAFLVKQLFANFAYNINGDIVERSFCLIGQIKLTVCFDSIIQLSKYFSSTHKARCLFARFCYTESIPLVKDDALSRDYECKTTLLLQDFSAALSLSRLSRLEAHNNDYFEEVKKASTSFSHELKSKTEGLLEANSEAVLLSSEVKALLLRLAKESQQRSLEYLQLSISANAQKLTSDNSFIYYVAIRHSKFFQESFDSKHGCGEGFVHVFALEQYLDNEQNEAFRLYNSY
ncbi:MAG: hypothetical protein GWP59_05720, partial [Chlamydiales bacterium]|nr:hypothetical protein [Chlamydiales bacterium]